MAPRYQGERAVAARSVDNWDPFARFGIAPVLALATL